MRQSEAVASCTFKRVRKSPTSRDSETTNSLIRSSLKPQNTLLHAGALCGLLLSSALWVCTAVATSCPHIETTHAHAQTHTHIKQNVCRHAALTVRAGLHWWTVAHWTQQTSTFEWNMYAEIRRGFFHVYPSLFVFPDGEPTRSAPSLPPPVLSVQPSTGIVKYGGTLSFSCSLPPSLPQSQHPSNYNNKPSLTFLLLRNAERTSDTSTVLLPPASQASHSELQPGVFSVGPVRGGEGGEYTCLYQITNSRGLFNSTVSNKVQITIAGESVVRQHLCWGLQFYTADSFKTLPKASLYTKLDFLLNYEVKSLYF